VIASQFKWSELCKPDKASFLRRPTHVVFQMLTASVLIAFCLRLVKLDIMSDPAAFFATLVTVLKNLGNVQHVNQPTLKFSFMILLAVHWGSFTNLTWQYVNLPICLTVIRATTSVSSYTVTAWDVSTFLWYSRPQHVSGRQIAFNYNIQFTCLRCSLRCSLHIRTSILRMIHSMTAAMQFKARFRGCWNRSAKQKS
jgi:hypothetical protein